MNKTTRTDNAASESDGFAAGDKAALGDGFAVGDGETSSGTDAADAADSDAFRLRDRSLAAKIIERTKALGVSAQFMHVCGTHQDTMVKHGLESVFSECGIKVIQGPGCPVCVTTPREIESAIALARAGKTVATFGDMVRVPGASGSLQSVREEGGDVRIVYGIDDAVGLARENPELEVVFVAIGFETTAPATASALLAMPPENFYILNCHRWVPPALKALAELGEVKLDGLIEPGHVSTIIGTEPYRFLSDAGLPQVVAGFEPIDMLMAVYMLARQVKEGRAEVENEYSRVVKPEGNTIAMEMLDKVFSHGDCAWRGFPVIPGSKMALREEFARYDAEKKFAEELKVVEATVFSEPKGCRCGELLRGLITPKECPLFSKVCTPGNPVGPCMVSFEGSCNIEYRYRKRNG